MKHFLNLNKKNITDQELFSHLPNSLCSLFILEPEKQQLLMSGKSVFTSQDLEVTPSSVLAPQGTASAPAKKTQEQLKGCAAPCPIPAASSEPNQWDRTRFSVLLEQPPWKCALSKLVLS